MPWTPSLAREQIAFSRRAAVIAATVFRGETRFTDYPRPLPGWLSIECENFPIPLDRDLVAAPLHAQPRLPFNHCI